MDRKVTLNIKREAVVPEPPPVIKPPHQLWRVMHDPEIIAKRISWVSHGQLYEEGRTWDWRAGYPEVFWMYQDDGKAIELTEQWQWLTYQLTPPITKPKWREVYDDWRAFANRTGFSHDPATDPDKTYVYVPKKDYVTPRDLSADILPALDKNRVCGGATISGYQDGNYVVVDALDWNNPPSNVDYIKSRPWLFFHAVSIVKRFDGTPIIDPFPQNGSYPTLVPIIARGRVRLPVVMLEKVDAVVDPLKIFGV